MIALFATLFLVSALVTLIVLISGSENRGPGARAESTREADSAVGKIIEDFSTPGVASGLGTAAGVREPLRVQDLMLPQAVQEDRSGPYLLRPRLDHWGEEQVKRYWVPPEDIALDLVRRENDRRIE